MDCASIGHLHHWATLSPSQYHENANLMSHNNEHYINVKLFSLTGFFHLLMVIMLTIELLLSNLSNKGIIMDKEGNVLFNDALNTFYVRLYGVRHMAKDHLIVRKETRCRNIGYSFRLTARVLLYALSHRQDSTYHGLYYTSCGALAGTRNSSMGPPHEGSIRRPITPWANALTTELHLAPYIYNG